MHPIHCHDVFDVGFVVLDDVKVSGMDSEGIEVSFAGKANVDDVSEVEGGGR